MYYHIEVVWNREVYWSQYGENYRTLEKAEVVAKALLNMSNGEAVKKARVLDQYGKIIIPYVKY